VGVEKIVQLFVGDIDAELFQAIRCKRTAVCQARVCWSAESVGR
jgi:hypothetical protein